MDTILTQTLSNSVTGKTDDNNSSNNETMRFKKKQMNESNVKNIGVLEKRNVSFKYLHFKNHHSIQKRRIFCH